MSAAKKGMAGLVLGAIGIVFGDIGTSPLYALQAVFGPVGQQLPISELYVHGIISIIIWAILLVVAIKYVGFVMKADNEGEGGIMALVGLIKSTTLSNRLRWFFIFFGLIGVALFYGDSAITPAISVLSAVEGLEIVEPDLSSLVVPITLVILTILFSLQRYGTKIIGRLFGPVMLIWFLTIAAGGLWQIAQHPDILAALSPLSAYYFIQAEPLIAFVALGAVVLAITGVEALYADMGHFGRPPIARAWFFLVFPALVLCYMGQGTLLLENSSASANSFFLLYPQAIQIPIIILATLATLIASQSVISGAFSLTRQAIQLNFLPRMLIKHTSDHEIGRVYLPFVNLALFVAVFLLVVYFGSSGKLANAYGIAVSGTLAIDTILFVVVMRSLWRKSLMYVVPIATVFLTVDLLFVSANLSKIEHGGWFPLLIALLIFIPLHTWIKGQRIVSAERKSQEGPLQDYIEQIRHLSPPITRIPGHAVYIGHHPNMVPLALRTTVEELHELHEKVVIVYVETTNAAHVPDEERAKFDGLVYADGISRLRLFYGFKDSINLPKTLESLRKLSPELDFDLNDASYFVSLSKVIPSERRTLLHWRKMLYSLMNRNALSPSDYYKLPVDRTVEMRTLIEL